MRREDFKRWVVVGRGFGLKDFDDEVEAVGWAREEADRISSERPMDAYVAVPILEVVGTQWVGASET